MPLDMVKRAEYSHPVPQKPPEAVTGELQVQAPLKEQSLAPQAVHFVSPGHWCGQDLAVSLGLAVMAVAGTSVAALLAKSTLAVREAWLATFQVAARGPLGVTTPLSAVTLHVDPAATPAP